MSSLIKDICRDLEKCDLSFESDVIERIKFNFEIEFPENECEDTYLQELCNKMVKKLWELPEIQEKFNGDFDSFDESFNMDLVGYGEEYVLAEEYLDDEVLRYL